MGLEKLARQGFKVCTAALPRRHPALSWRKFTRAPDGLFVAKVQPRGGRGSRGRGRAMGAPNPTGTEIEIKLRIPSRDEHKKVEALFHDGYCATHKQKNVFFDGASGELEKRRVVMRIRFYETTTDGGETMCGHGELGAMQPSRCVLTLKGKSVIKDGVGVASEIEHDIGVDDGYRCIDDPSHILNLVDTTAPPADGSAAEGSAIVRQVIDTYGVREFKCLGGFDNIRNVFRWQPGADALDPASAPDESPAPPCLNIELDETRFAHGTLFELEVETADPGAVKDALERALRTGGIQFSYSAVSKFSNFIRGTLD